MSSTTTPPSQDTTPPTLSDLNRRLSRLERRFARHEDRDLALRVAELEAYVAQQRVADLEARLAAVSVAEDLPPPRQSTPPPTNKGKGKAKADAPASSQSSSFLSSATSSSALSPPTSSSAAPSATPTRPPPQYVYSTPEKGTTFTSEWSEAGAQTQGVPQSHVKKLFNSPRDKTRRACFVVFRGHQAGVMDDWAAVETAIRKFSGAVYCGYQSRADATRAFNHALEAGWTSTTPHSPGELPMAPDKTPRPITTYDLSLFGDRVRARGSQETWYVVYVGIRPGVYATWLETALNTIAVHGSVFHKAESFEAAAQKFAQATVEGNVESKQTPSK
ncbi:hypothetical protein C8F01DRAFT_1284703 [Mycena amicta]|nr:hypothetical protein C8F01DRAFT_1284703 [Mycena amicta]